MSQRSALARNNSKHYNCILDTQGQVDVVTWRSGVPQGSFLLILFINGEYINCNKLFIADDFKNLVKTSCWTART